MSLRDQILEADDLKSEVVDVPEWGVRIEVRSMNGRDRAKALGKMASAGGTPDLVAAYAHLTIASAYDPETGERIFTDSDVDSLLAKSGAVLERIATKALEVADMTDGAVEGKKGVSS